MSVRRPGRGLCTFCIRTRIAGTAIKRPLARAWSTQTATPLNQVPPLESTDLPYDPARDGPILSKEDTDDQLYLRSPLDSLKGVLTSDIRHDVFKNELRMAVLRAVRGIDQGETGESKDKGFQRRRSTEYNATKALDAFQFPGDGGMMPREAFREAVALYNPLATGSRPIRRILREQIIRCQRPHELLQVFACAMSRKSTAQQIATMHMALVAGLFNCRKNVDDSRILTVLNIIISRLKIAGLPVDVELLGRGLQFSARARSLHGMKRYLQEFRDRGIEMSKKIFRSTIGKFSIGFRGLGELRNGRWTRAELLQVLHGFPDTPPEEAHHLSVFLKRNEWGYLNAWITVLARCKDTESILKEWELWCKSDRRINPVPLQKCGPRQTTKYRGDHCFVEQMCIAGDIGNAWMMLKASDIQFKDLRRPARVMLMQEPWHASSWDESMKAAMLDRYTLELERIESALGVSWVPGPDGEEGHHDVPKDRETALEELSNPEALTVPPHGYPWDATPLEDTMLAPLTLTQADIALERRLTWMENAKEDVPR